MQLSDFDFDLPQEGRVQFAVCDHIVAIGALVHCLLDAHFGLLLVAGGQFIAGRGEQQEQCGDHRVILCAKAIRLSA